MEFDGCVGVSHEGKLATNGKPSDKLTLDPNAKYSACAGAKIAGTISGLTLKPAEGQSAAITIKSAIHVLVEPWCVYAIPKTITMPPSSETITEVTVPAPLEKRASFGACAPIRTFELRVIVTEAAGGEPFFTEVV